MSSPKDTAADVFDRINRSRDGVGQAPLMNVSPAHPLPFERPPASPGRRIDQVFFDEPDLLPSKAGAAAADTFPRSATMRAILKHPVLALGLGLPAAGLLMTSPGARRMLAGALRIGTLPELTHLLHLSAAATRGNPRPPLENPLERGQKKPREGPNQGGTSAA